MSKLFVISIALWLASCNSVERNYRDTGELLDRAMPLIEYQEASVSGSIFRDQSRSTNFGFKKNVGIGDILTVVLSESTQAQRSNGFDVSKEVSNSPFSQLQAAFPAVVDDSGIKKSLKALTLTEQNRSTKGAGISDQAGSLNGALAVIVTRILPNGILFVEGKKDLMFSEGREEIYLSGLVKPDDVQPDDTVLSSRIAQANIAYRGRGELADVARNSWGTKTFNKIWPF